MELTEIEAKAKALSAKLDCDVTPIIMTVKGEQIVGYFQEMSVDVMLFAQDKLMEEKKKYSDIGEMILGDCLLKDESDPRISSDERKHAKIKGSFTLSCVNMAVPYLNEYKKK